MRLASSSAFAASSAAFRAAASRAAASSASFFAAASFAAAASASFLARSSASRAFLAAALRARDAAPPNFARAPSPMRGFRWGTTSCVSPSTYRSSALASATSYGSVNGSAAGVGWAPYDGGGLRVGAGDAAGS